MTSPTLVPGTLLVAALLATARWGSYLGVPSMSVFLTEVLLVAGAIGLAARHRHLLRPDVISGGRALLPVWLLLVWVVIRFAAGGAPSMDAFRDAAPYVYAGLAGCHLIAVPVGARVRTTAVLVGGLLVHLAWVSVTIVQPDLSDRLPLLGGKVHVLELRPDADGALLAVLAGLAAQQVLRRRSWRDRAVALVFVLWPAYLVLETGSRSALLALVAGCAVVGLVEAPRVIRLPRRVVVGAAIVGVALLAVVVPQTSAYDRLVGGAANAANNASGTATARQEAYGIVLDYLRAEPSRIAFGVGFGPDFLQDSGADGQYEGTVYQDVRSPHNYLLGTLARLGIPGLLLVLWVVTAAAVSFRRVVHRRTETAVLAGLIGATLVTVAMFGVVLEAPFGAVPFFWAVGLLLVHGAREPAATPVEQAPQGPADRQVAEAFAPAVELVAAAPPVSLEIRRLPPMQPGGTSAIIVRRSPDWPDRG